MQFNVSLDRLTSVAALRGIEHAQSCQEHILAWQSRQHLAPILQLSHLVLSSSADTSDFPRWIPKTQDPPVPRLPWPKNWCKASSGKKWQQDKNGAITRSFYQSTNLVQSVSFWWVCLCLDWLGHIPLPNPQPCHLIIYLCTPVNILHYLSPPLSPLSLLHRRALTHQCCDQQCIISYNPYSILPFKYPSAVY